MDQLNQRVNELEIDNNHMKQMIVILEQMSVDLMPIVMKCKCDYNSVKIKTKLNVLKQKYNNLQQNNNNFVKIVDKIKNCSKSVQKIVIKRVDDFDENLAIDEDINKTHEKSTLPKRRRGRPPKTAINFIENTIKQEINDQKTFSEKLKKQRINSNKQKGNKIIRKYTKIRVNKEVSDFGSNQQKFNKKRNQKNVLCNECGKQFRDTYELKFHEWRHSGQKLFWCDWPGCNKQFSSRYLLKHQKTHSDPKRFVCNFDDCNQSYESNEELNKHFIDSHDGHKPFKCDFDGCNQQFSSKPNILQHINWNHSTKQYVCEWPGCDSSFKRKHLLRDHMNVKHIGNVKYRCEWPGCEFKTGHNKSFARHKLIHTGEKPFKCEFEGCEWRFRQPHQLKQHYLVHTGDSPVSCQFQGCDHRFKTRRVMLSHFKKCHPIAQSIPD